MKEKNDATKHTIRDFYQKKEKNFDINKQWKIQA